MARRWISFNYEVTNAEILAMPREDFMALSKAMKVYGLEEDGGFVVKNYGEGLMMIKATNRTQGRCLFFTVTETVENGETGQVLTAVLFYKKETQEVPSRILETARERMKRAQEE